MEILFHGGVGEPVSKGSKDEWVLNTPPTTLKNKKKSIENITALASKITFLSCMHVHGWNDRVLSNWHRDLCALHATIFVACEIPGVKK